MSRFRFTNKAVDDLSDIWNYTVDTWSEKQADIYYEMLIDSCRKISVNPQLGRNYYQIANSIFGYRAGSHILFYRIITNEEIEIARILHIRMDLKSGIIE